MGQEESRESGYSAVGCTVSRASLVSRNGHVFILPSHTPAANPRAHREGPDPSIGVTGEIRSPCNEEFGPGRILMEGWPAGRQASSAQRPGPVDLTRRHVTLLTSRDARIKGRRAAASQHLITPDMKRRAMLFRVLVWLKAAEPVATGCHTPLLCPFPPFGQPLFPWPLSALLATTP